MAEGDARSAMLGAAVGGVLAVVGSLGTTAITQKHETDLETKKATGAARLLADDLRRAEDVMDASLQDCRYRLYDVGLQLPIDDRLLLAWRLEPGQWAKVAEGMSAVKLEISRSREPHEFVQDDVKQIRFAIHLVDTARQSLQKVSGEGPYPSEIVKREMTHGRSC